MLTILVLMDLFDSFGHVCDHRYLKLVILAFFVVPDQLLMVTLEYFAIRAKVIDRDPKSYD